ncbi:translation initiation factor IF-2 [Bubalus bubalis]|uniref:translation initiation factor IF-2 n=2 Tax=Bubalus TaxID=9918 RepID=UPI001D106861|nr:translation initiation factor IF-2 [Bubalus bubalis]
MEQKQLNRTGHRHRVKVWAPGSQHRREGLGALSGPGGRKEAGWTTSTPLGTRKPRRDPPLSAYPRGAGTTPLPGPCRRRPRPHLLTQPPGRTTPNPGRGDSPTAHDPWSLDGTHRGSRAAAVLLSSSVRTGQDGPRSIPFRDAPHPISGPGSPPTHPPRAVVSPARPRTAAPGLCARLHSTTPTSVRCSGECPPLPRDCRSRVTAARCPHAPAPLAAKMMCGGPSATQPATAETQAIADKVKSQLEEKENKKFPMFKALEFKSQLVAGKNYFIKVQVDEDDFVHIRVFESLPHENKPVALTSYQTNKGRHDELTYF